MSDEQPMPPSEPVAGEPPAEAAAPAPAADAEQPAANGEPGRLKQWYVVKVQSGREDSIKDAIERRVKIEGLEEFFGQIIIPTEKVVEMRNNKRVVRERKLFPGYLMVECEYNDRILYLFRETSGVGDFVGGSLTQKPQPMGKKEIDRITQKAEVPDAPKQIGKPKFDRGDRVRVKEGMFAGMEGEVQELLEAKHAVRVVLTVFGRNVPVELEYWAVEPV